jgi:hypothetical protein
MMPDAICTSVCGVLNIQARLASMGWMMRAEDASEMTGVALSAITSRIARLVGVSDGPRIRSTLSSDTRRRAFFTAVVVSEASSSTM